MGTLTIAGRSFRSRLMLGTRQYRSPAVMEDCRREAEAEIITVAVRRVNVSEGHQDWILNHLTGNSYFLFPNTDGCRTADQAIRASHLAREDRSRGRTRVRVLSFEKGGHGNQSGFREEA